MIRNLLENKVISKIALVSWCILIFIFSNVPNLKTGLEEDFLLRKIAHGFEYSVLALLIYHVLRQYNFFGFYLFVVTFLASFSYALTDEIHQTFVLGRSGNFFDVGVDSVGILLTLSLLIIYRFTKTRYGS